MIINYKSNFLPIIYATKKCYLRAYSNLIVLSYFIQSRVSTPIIIV